MDTGELVALTRWINEQIASTGIPKDYARLATFLQRVDQSAGNAQLQQQAQQQITAARNQLISKLQAVDLFKLTDEQLMLLTRLGIRAYVGLDGISLVEAVFENGVNNAERYSRVVKMAKEIQAGLDRSEKIRASLDGVLEAAEADENDIQINVGSFEIRVGYATCGLRREKSSLPAIRKMTVRMVSSRV